MEIDPNEINKAAALAFYYGMLVGWMLGFGWAMFFLTVAR